jgi:hypothetical protein
METAMSEKKKILFGWIAVAVGSGLLMYGIIELLKLF